MAENKVEDYLIQLMYTYHEIGENMWLIEDSEQKLEGVVVMYTDPVIIVRTAVMRAPEENRLELFTRLLELNANDVLHGAYALEGDEIVLVNTLIYDTMDFSEFRATLDAFGLALTQHYPILSKYRTKE